MMEVGPSTTAQRVALLRAAHQIIDDSPKLLTDPVAPRLFLPEVIAAIPAQREHFMTPAILALRSHVLVRSRYAEDQLALAVARGVRQFLILGAGWDTFAYRQPLWAREIRVFEADQPASQQQKRQRLHDAGIAIPPNVGLVPIDFETTSLKDGLQKSQFDFTAPTFIAWLGVMVYLTRDAIDAVLRFVTTLPTGSEIVLTFTQPRPLLRPSPLATIAATYGEPWKIYFTEEELHDYLTHLGFSSVVMPTPHEITAWYFQQRKDGLSASPRKNLLRASV
jgi:methyltransferase (TIGR00027 family)